MATDVIEARQANMLLDVVTYPHLKTDSQRRRISKHYTKLATVHADEEVEPISIEEFAQIIAGKLNG